MDIIRLTQVGDNNFDKEAIATAIGLLGEGSEYIIIYERRFRFVLFNMI